MAGEKSMPLRKDEFYVEAGSRKGPNGGKMTLKKREAGAGKC